MFEFTKTKGKRENNVWNGSSKDWVEWCVKLELKQNVLKERPENERMGWFGEGGRFLVSTVSEGNKDR